MKLQISQRQFKLIAFFILIVVLLVLKYAILFAIVPLTIVLFFDKKVTKKEVLFSAIFGIIFLLLIDKGIVCFPMFPQAADLFVINEDIFFWFFREHPHAIRLLIVYPGVVISKVFNVTIDLGVTIYSVSLLLLIQLFMMRMLNTKGHENNTSSILSGVILLALSMVMNGRLIFVFFGTSLLVLYELKYKEKETNIIILQIITGVSVFFTMVSSGTMVVSIAYAVLILPHRWRKLVNLREKKLFLVTLLLGLTPVVLYLFPYVIMMTVRNIDYFGGGIQGTINLIKHGLGKFIDTNNNLIVVALLVIGISIVLINVHLFSQKVSKKKDPYLPLILMVNLSAYGSVFGLSTGLTGLIPLLVLVIYKFDKMVKLRLW